MRYPKLVSLCGVLNSKTVLNGNYLEWLERDRGEKTAPRNVASSRPAHKERPGQRSKADRIERRRRSVLACDKLTTRYHNVIGIVFHQTRDGVFTTKRRRPSAPVAWPAEESKPCGRIRACYPRDFWKHQKIIYFTLSYHECRSNKGRRVNT